MRASPAYELVLSDRLSADERETLGEVARDPGFYGILRPRGGENLTSKAVSRDAALLLLTLRKPGLLPGFAIDSLGSVCDATIERMILDGVLEIECGSRMLSGPEAAAFLYKESAPASKSKLATLSREALEYGVRLKLNDRVLLSSRLYSYNTVPVSPRWRRLFADRAAVERYLGIEESKAQTASRGWLRSPATTHDSWMAWQSPRALHRVEPPITYKLYVSPDCEDLRNAFRGVADSVGRHGAFHWKVGCDAAGLLRPDKIVVYFDDYSQLQEMAAVLLRCLDGCKAQGVPFTAELAGDGLLSWGIDPPVATYAVPWLKRESWRTRICNVLAGALTDAQARSSFSAMSPVEYAMKRIRLDGVDSETWAPTNAFVWADAIHD